MNRIFLLLAGIALLVASCGSSTPAPAAELPPSPTASAASPSPTEPPPTLTPTPTPVPLVGILTAEVNVRSGPGTSYSSLGLLGRGESVQVTLQSDDGQWYRILYPSAPEGYGWVAVRYVSLPEPTALQTIMPGVVYGRVLTRLNVRAGPGTSFETVGTLESGMLVILKGRNSSASWFQIEYPIGTSRIGWVTAQYIETDRAGELPVLDEYGAPVATGMPGPTSQPVTPTPTVGPAAADGDSASAPAVSVVFSPVGTRRFTYSSQVSAPEGDAEDWLEFIPFASLPGAEARLQVSLACTGGALSVELWRGGAPLAGWGTLVCGDKNLSLSMPAGNVYQFRLAASGNSQQLISYSLTIENLP